MTKEKVDELVKEIVGTRVRNRKRPYRDNDPLIPKP